MGACISQDDIDDDDLKRWQEKKKSSKGACVPKVGPIPILSSSSAPCPPTPFPTIIRSTRKENFPLSCLAMTKRQTRMFSQVDYTPLAMSNDLKKMGNRIATHKK